MKKKNNKKNKPSILPLANNISPMYKQFKELRISLDKLLVKYQISWKNPKLLGQKVRDNRIGIISKTFLGIKIFASCQKEKEYESLMLFKVILHCRTPNSLGRSCPASSTPVSQSSSHMKMTVSRKKFLAAESTVFTGNKKLRIFPMCFNSSFKEGNIL